VNEGPPPDAIVLRFPPGGFDDVVRILNEAKRVHAYHRKADGSSPWYRLSVFVSQALVGESEAETVHRLMGAAGLSGIRLDDARNRVWWVTRASELYTAGFSFVKDDYDTEVAEHFSVDIGPDVPTEETVARFVAVFSRREAGT
jgi:hypothetical protein